MNNMPLQMHRIPKAPAASKSRRPTLALFALFVVKLLLFRQAKRVIPKKEKGYIKMDTSNATRIILIEFSCLVYMEYLQR